MLIPVPSEFVSASSSSARVMPRRRWTVQLSNSWPVVSTRRTRAICCPPDKWSESAVVAYGVIHRHTPVVICRARVTRSRGKRETPGAAAWRAGTKKGNKTTAGVDTIDSVEKWREVTGVRSRTGHAPVRHTRRAITPLTPHKKQIASCNYNIALTLRSDSEYRMSLAVSALLRNRTHWPIKTHASNTL